MKRPTIGIIGAGRLGSTLAPLLVQAGYRLTAVASAGVASARRLARAARTSAFRTVEEVPRRAECLLLAVPDRAVATVALRLAERAGSDLDGRIVLHLAGGYGVEPLAPVAAHGADVGVLHPLQTFSDPKLASSLVRGSRARVEGTPRALRAARRLARDLGLVLIVPARAPRADDRIAYHAAAALAANDLLGLLDAATEILVGSGVPRRTAERALVRLASGALAHAERHGLAGALTGPVARGDAETVRRHLGVLSRRAPDAARVHRLLSRRLLALAGPRRGTAAAAAIERALGARRGRSRGSTV